MRILLAGESWTTYQLHIKGAAGFATGGYGDGFRHLRDFAVAVGHEVDLLPNELVARDFPRSADALAAYDVVVLSDLPSDSLLLAEGVLDGRPAPDGIDALVAYVAAGGGLLMVGGYMSFAGINGSARYGETELAAVLPVNMSATDDRRERPAGVIPTTVDPDHEVLAGVGGAWPPILGYNRVSVKPEAQTVLMAGADPLLVLGAYGRGRTAAYTSDLAPHWASQDFMVWPALPRLWNNLLNWVGSPVAADDVVPHSPTQR
ncbi:MAG TPA: glutamine amidotransferase [Gryllotalpicola sp.]